MLKFEFFFLFLIQAIFSQSVSYDYLKNGADWANLCANGTEQSPIDINTDNVIKCDPNMMIQIQWSNQNLTSSTQNLGVTYESSANWSIVYASDYDGDVYGYDAYEFDFHAPSEHTVNGQYFDLEMQVFHSLKSEFQAENPVRNIAIVSLLFTVDDSQGDNLFFTQYDPTSTNQFTLNMSLLLGNQTQLPLQYYLYPGSFTTPPCLEVVNWYVLAIPLTLSSNQQNKFTSAWAQNSSFAGGNGNNRVIMPLNSRSVKVGGLALDACQEDFVSFFGFFVLFLFLIYVIFQVVP